MVLFFNFNKISLILCAVNAPIIDGIEKRVYKKNSRGNKLWEPESAIISQIAASGNINILIMPTNQKGALLIALTKKPDKNRKLKLYFESPYIPVLIKGNNGEL